MKNCLLARPHDGGEEAFSHSHSARHGCRASALFWAVGLLALASPIALEAQTNVINSLDPGQLTTALQAGGTVTFATNGTIVLTNTITISNNVILDGTNHAITISGGGAVELFKLPPGLSLTLRNLRLANGLQNGDYVSFNGQTYPGTGHGGAIFTQGNLDIENCTFANNGVISPSVPYSDGGSTLGGAIYNSGTMTISNTLFVSNAVAGGGGGSGGDTSTAGSGFGGAIYNSGGAISLGNVIFSNNAAVGGTGIPAVYGGYAGEACGGALYSSGGSVQANNLQVFNNAARGGVGTFEEIPPVGSPGAAAQGGAFYLTGCASAVSNSIFSNNVAAGGLGANAASGVALGGSIVNSGSALFWNCDLEYSRAQGCTGGFAGGDSGASAGMGGAIFNTGTMQMTGSTVSNSSANGGSQNGRLPADGMGGAIYNTGSLEIDGTTLSGNSCAGGSPGPFPIPDGNGWGGAIYNAGFVQLSSAILSSNATSGQTNFGEAIYSTGVIESDANSKLVPYVTGTPPLTYQWQANGNNIASATNSNFNLGNVQFADAGTYDLVISNASGLVTNFAEIINQPPPPLTISSVTPDTGLTNGGTSVTITGTGFTNGATVSFGNAAATSVTVVSATNITAYTPAVTTAGAVNVVVINADFQPVVLTNGFTFVAPVSISSPQQGGTLGTGIGTFTVTIGGASLAGWNFIIECSTDLVNWEPLQTNSSPFTFTDTNAASYPLRFYRAVFVQ